MQFSFYSLEFTFLLFEYVVAELVVPNCSPTQFDSKLFSVDYWTLADISPL